MILFLSCALGQPPTPEDPSTASTFTPPICLDTASDPEALRGLVARYAGIRVVGKLNVELELRCKAWVVFYNGEMLCTGRRLAPDTICTFPTVRGSLGAAVGDACPAHSLEEALRLQLERLIGCPDEVIIDPVLPPTAPVPPPQPSGPVTVEP